jgi:hypothetical protein
MNQFLVNLLQVITALGLLNVWLVRFNKKTSYRGGEANNIIEEFAVYGLPIWFCYVIGFLKIGSALSLLLGVYFPFLTFPSALLILCLMIGAVLMHIKVKDPLKKAIPASVMLTMSALICIATLPL